MAQREALAIEVECLFLAAGVLYGHDAVLVLLAVGADTGTARRGVVDRRLAGIDEIAERGLDPARVLVFAYGGSHEVFSVAPFLAASGKSKSSR